MRIPAALQHLKCNFVLLELQTQRFSFCLFVKLPQKRVLASQELCNYMWILILHFKHLYYYTQPQKASLEQVCLYLVLAQCISTSLRLASSVVVTENFTLGCPCCEGPEPPCLECTPRKNMTRTTAEKPRNLTAHNF